MNSTIMLSKKPIHPYTLLPTINSELHTSNLELQSPTSSHVSIADATTTSFQAYLQLSFQAFLHNVG